MKSNIPSFLLEQPSTTPYKKSRGRLKKTFVEKGIHYIAEIIKSSYVQWETASKDGLFQRIDPRVKVLFLLLFILIVSLKREITPEVILAGFVFILIALSRLDVFGFYRRVLVLGFLFGFLIALPSAFNVITKGEVIFPLFHFSRDYQFWVYHVPREFGITREGLNGVILLTLRVVNSLSLSFLLLYTTPFPEIIKALKVLKVPDSFLMIITLTYKYIFIFSKTVEDMYLAKKSRLVGQVNDGEARNWVTGRIAFIFKKTRLRCEEIFKAMLSKGFSEDIKLYESKKMKPLDFTAGAVFLVVGAVFLWM